MADIVIAGRLGSPEAPLRAWLKERAAERAYAPDGAGYEECRADFTQHQRGEAEEREAKRRRASGPSA